MEKLLNASPSLRLPFLYQTRTIQSLSLRRPSRAAYNYNSIHHGISRRQERWTAYEGKRGYQDAAPEQGEVDTLSGDASEPIPSWIPRSRKVTSPSPPPTRQPEPFDLTKGLENFEKKKRSQDLFKSKGPIPFLGEERHSPRGRKSPIPFAEEELHPPSGENVGHHEQSSTMTRSERAAFEHLLRAMPHSETEAQKASSKDDPRDELDEEEKTDPGEDVMSVFDKATEKARGADEQRATAMEKTEDKVNYQLAIDPTSSLDYGRPDLVSSQQRYGLSDIEVETKKHRRETLKKLGRSRTDVDLWEVLENDVFSLIRVYNKRQEEDKARRAAEETATKSKGRTSRAIKAPESSNTSFASEKASSKKKRKKKEKEEEKVNVPEQIASLSTPLLISIVQRNYGDCCLEALRTLRSHFFTSPYTMNLLPTIKSLGPSSHVLAASTELYNELLFVKWREYNDLHGVADLLEEMANRGIEYDGATLAVLQIIRRAWFYAHNTPGERNRKLLWWQMQPVRDAWDRVRGMMRKVKYEVQMSKIRMAAEDNDMEEEDEEPDVGEDEDNLVVVDDGEKEKRIPVGEPLLL
ncbi:MAG: hypothetical protein LQ342_002236 [Letrouitia transgressa]|nr:MAG: hypothetical protein LQ342_002236 [Letrouitia transgressa]